MNKNNLYKWIPNDEFHHGMYDREKHTLVWRYKPSENTRHPLGEVYTTDSHYGFREKSHVMIIELYVQGGSDE